MLQPLAGKVQVAKSFVVSSHFNVFNSFEARCEFRELPLRPVPFSVVV